MRELLFQDSRAELALGVISDQMPPDACTLFYKAQVVTAHLGWKPPYLYNPRLQARFFVYIPRR